VFENVLTLEVFDSFVDLLLGSRELHVNALDVSNEILVNDNYLLHNPILHIDEVVFEFLDQYLSMLDKLLPDVCLALLFCCLNVYQIISDITN
jgi:hypothetical protein